MLPYQDVQTVLSGGTDLSVCMSMYLFDCASCMQACLHASPVDNTRMCTCVHGCVRIHIWVCIMCTAHIYMERWRALKVSDININMNINMNMNINIYIYTYIYI